MRSRMPKISHIVSIGHLCACFFILQLDDPIAHRRDSAIKLSELDFSALILLAVHFHKEIFGGAVN